MAKLTRRQAEQRYQQAQQNFQQAAAAIHQAQAELDHNGVTPENARALADAYTTAINAAKTARNQAAESIPAAASILNRRKLLEKNQATWAQTIAELKQAAQQARTLDALTNYDTNPESRTP